MTAKQAHTHCTQKDTERQKRPLPPGQAPQSEQAQNYDYR